MGVCVPEACERKEKDWLLVKSRIAGEGRNKVRGRVMCAKERKATEKAVRCQER